MKFLNIRSLLCVPAHKPHTYAKAMATTADCLMYDLEDSVPPQHKQKALALLLTHLRQVRHTSVVTVRINPDRLEEEAQSLKPYVAAFVVPKVRTASDLCTGTFIPTIPVIETPEAIVNLRPIAAGSAGLIFGIADFAAGMGVSDRLVAGRFSRSSYTLNRRFAYAKQKIATYGAAFGIPTLDTCFVVKGDDCEVAVLEAWVDARTIGFTGAACIHPMQVPIANEVFGLLHERAWAEETHARFAAGHGEVYADAEGLVVGRPVDRQAERIVGRNR